MLKSVAWKRSNLSCRADSLEFNESVQAVQIVEDLLPNERHCQ